MYDQKQIEEKWQKIWETNRLFQQTERMTDQSSNNSMKKFADMDGKEYSEKDNIYLLFAFAYPSGSGLHVGHVESKTALDILARFYRMKGKNVFFPVGWDAFGLPAENYAIKTGVHPSKTTVDAINTFRRQIKRVGISYDWANEIATSHPEYYKWTQWIFLQMFNKGLAYQKDGKVNWCPSCQTVLANEQVIEGLCERCDHEVEQKNMRQWYYQITKYQDELISGLDEVDWPAATKAQQLNWIGKKIGIDISYKVDGLERTITCFTTRPDTNFGATFVVIAPEHELATDISQGKVVPTENAQQIKDSVIEYLDQASKKTELDRQQEGKKKSGVFTGFYALNDLTGKKMPIWISDFVLGGFGTGAVVGVPGHDVRDFQFAEYVNSLASNNELKDQVSIETNHQTKNQAKIQINSQVHIHTDKIEIIRVVVGPDKDDSIIKDVTQVQEDQGKMINSGFLDGLEIHEATKKIMDYLEEKGIGKRVTSYRLRDWLISRQRYWGTPIPIVYDPEGNSHPIGEEYLPWKLPVDVDFKPTGESPLKSSQEFIDRTKNFVSDAYSELIEQKGWDKSGEGWRPEFDTMDTFVDSSWYFLRYVDSRNQDAFAAPDQLDKWLPVDLYMIGPEHIVLHLLYSRFFTKFLRDEGCLNFDEPFLKMRHQGMILGPDNKKMSKSKGNVINPDEIIEKFGADTLRVYEMFMGPLDSDKPWDIRAVIGVYKFLQKTYRLVLESEAQVVSGELKTVIQRKLHQAIKKVSEDLPQLKFNTSIAFLMEFVNLWQDAIRENKVTLSNEDKILFVQIIAPFAPFLADELYSKLTNNINNDGQYNGVHISHWPEYNPDLSKANLVNIPVQINGKLRAQLEVSTDLLDEEIIIINMALGLENIQKYLEGRIIKKKIYVPGKIVSLVV
ncbi:MAG: leucine--tRNA ligase [Pseudomonadales bacterium]|nr:leucine--tRNA ligase [Pseudomonadales bacterium]